MTDNLRDFSHHPEFVGTISVKLGKDNKISIEYNYAKIHNAVRSIKYSILSIRLLVDRKYGADDLTSPSKKKFAYNHLHCQIHIRMCYGVKKR